MYFPLLPTNNAVCFGGSFFQNMQITSNWALPSFTEMGITDFKIYDADVNQNSTIQQYQSKEEK